MKQFVNQNPRQFFGAPCELLIQDYMPFPDKRRCVNRLAERLVGIKLAATGAKIGQEAYTDRSSFERQPFGYRLNGLAGAARVLWA